MAALKPLLKEQAITAFNANYIKSLLFGSGEAGVLYVPVPQFDGQTLLFQDDAGTAPVVDDGDPAGLMLDLHKGLELGPELVSNGTFDTDTTGWVAGSGATLDVVSGELRVKTPVGDNFSNANQAFTTESGKFYEVSITLTELSGSSAPIGVSSTATGPRDHLDLDTSVLGKHSGVFQGDGTTVYVFLGAFGDGSTAKFDNISVRELPGNHATQTTSADRPTYNTDGTLHWLHGDGAGDHLEIPEIVFPGEFLLSVALRAEANDVRAMMFGSDISSETQKVGNNQGAWFARVINGGSSINAGVVDTLPHVLSVTRDSSDNVKLFVDGAEIGAMSQAGSISFTTAFGTLNGPQFWLGSMYGAVICDQPGERGSVESYLANLAGITL